MTSRTSAKVTASIAVLGLGALCRCSLAFSLDGLDSANGGGGVLDGTAGLDVALREDRAVAAVDAANDSGTDATARDGGGTVSDAASDGDAGPAADSGSDAGVDVATGLVAFYRFDETSGTSAADASGNGHTATLKGGASFASGLTNNAVSIAGNSQYVSVPAGIVSSLTSCSISAWVKLSTSPGWSRIFDFGTGATTYMFLTPDIGTGMMRFSITTGGSGAEQRVTVPALPTGSWQHVALTLTGSTATLYVNGAQAGQNASVTLNPASLGTTSADWLGRSQFSGDPYLDGLIDNFRIYGRSLSAAEVQTLYAGHL
jgi:hypothetical protein